MGLIVIKLWGSNTYAHNFMGSVDPTAPPCWDCELLVITVKYLCMPAVSHIMLYCNRFMHQVSSVTEHIFMLVMQ